MHLRFGKLPGYVAIVIALVLALGSLPSATLIVPTVSASTQISVENYFHTHFASTVKVARESGPYTTQSPQDTVAAMQKAFHVPTSSETFGGGNTPIIDWTTAETQTRYSDYIPVWITTTVAGDQPLHVMGSYLRRGPTTGNYGADDYVPTSPGIGNNYHIGYSSHPNGILVTFYFVAKRSPTHPIEFFMPQLIMYNPAQAFDSVRNESPVIMYWNKGSGSRYANLKRLYIWTTFD